MQIKRFNEPDMRRAMRRVRKALGPDAVILETEETAAGVEITAAVDYDPAAYRLEVESRRPTTDDEATSRESTHEWLAERGRRVVVRSCVALGRELIQSVRRWGATVLLELAHPRPSHQRALVGPTAEPASALLLPADDRQKARSPLRANSCDDRQRGAGAGDAPARRATAGTA